MGLLHSAKDTSVRFDDPNLVSCAGLVAVMRLAQYCDLAGLVAEQVRVSVSVGANTHLKIPAMAGMVTGADCIDDLDVLGHGGMDTVGAENSDTDVTSSSGLQRRSGVFDDLNTFNNS